MINFFVRPIIRPPANLYKNDGGGGGGEGGGPKFVYPEMAYTDFGLFQIRELMTHMLP